MAEFDIDVTELEDYARVIRRAANQGATAYDDIAEKYQDLTMREARRIAPYDEGRRSGVHLRDSFEKQNLTARRGSLDATWTVTARHGAPQEYGFIHYISGAFIPAQPYVRPALKKFRKPYVEELAKRSGLNLQAAKNPGRSGVFVRRS